MLCYGNFVPWLKKGWKALFSPTCTLRPVTDSLHVLLFLSTVDHHPLPSCRNYCPPSSSKSSQIQPVTTSPNLLKCIEQKKIEGPTVWACEQQCATSCHAAVTESQLFKRGHRFSGPLCLLSVRRRPGWGTLLIPQLRLGRVLCSLVKSFFPPLSSDTLVQRREKNELRWWEMTNAGSALHQTWRIKLLIQVVDHQDLQVKPFSLTNRVNDFKLG